MQLFALRGYDDIRIGRGYNRTTGEVFLRLTHHVPPGTTLIVDEPFIWIWFYTDYDYRQRGFEIEVTRTQQLGKVYKYYFLNCGVVQNYVVLRKFFELRNKYLVSNLKTK